MANAVYALDPEFHEELMYPMDGGEPVCGPEIYKKREDSVYPSTWFEAHPGSKPPLQYRAGTPDTQFTVFQNMLTNHHWNDEIVTSYMVSIIREQHAIFTVTNTGQEWSSFNRVIAQAGEDVDPLCVLDLDEGDPWPAQATGESGVKERLSALWGLFLAFRRSQARALNEAYGQEVGACLQTFRGLGMMEREEQRFAYCVSKQYLTSGYCKVMAAIDMFFYHFKDAPFAKIRMATRSTRFRGCVAHTSLDQVSHELGIDPLLITDFVFSRRVAKDITRLRKGGQHKDDLHGYFPYQLDLQLTTRSAYSMGANPTFYLWIHAIGVMAGFMRSVNAKTPKDAIDLSGTLDPAIAVGLELAKGGDFTTESVNLKANEILDHLKINGGLDAKQRALVFQKVQCYRTARSDTIGGTLYRMYGRALC